MNYNRLQDLLMFYYREIAENTPLQLLQPHIRDHVTTSITSAKLLPIVFALYQII